MIIFMFAYRFYGKYSITNILSTLISNNKFGIALDVDEVYTYASILPVFTRETNIGYLYLIQSYHRGILCLKIGKTIDLRRRMYEYDICGELQKIIGVYVVWNRNLGELFLIRTFNCLFIPASDNDNRIGREYYIWNELVQQLMVNQIHNMIEYINN